VRASELGVDGAIIVTTNSGTSDGSVLDTCEQKQGESKGSHLGVHNEIYTLLTTLAGFMHGREKVAGS